jgi:acetyl-CoA carboxylase biotin carboxyl carrier protein
VIIDLDQLKQILNLMREHGLAEFEIEHEGQRIKLRKDAAGQLVTVPTPSAAGHAAAPSAAPVHQATGVSSVAAAASGMLSADADVELAIVKSPIVGTFYRSPEPSAPPFVEIGAEVKKGQVLCIIEAMKLMNEIDSEYDGEIVNIYVETGQPVQYGERLFAIKTK